MRRREPLADQLARVPLFAGLSDDELHALQGHVARVKEPAGVLLTKEGEKGHEFVIVLEGEVEVRHGDRVVATLGAGDWFGELALLDPDARRTATVVSRTPVAIGFLGRHDFERLLTELPAIATRIAAIAAARRAELGDQPA